MQITNGRGDLIEDFIKKPSLSGTRAPKTGLWRNVASL